MTSNKITSVRIANLAESEDTTLYKWIDFDNLKIHGLVEYIDVGSKKEYFMNTDPGSRVKIMDVLEDGLRVAVVFKLIKNDLKTTHFDVYHFNDLGMLVELRSY